MKNTCLFLHIFLFFKIDFNLAKEFMHLEEDILGYSTKNIPNLVQLQVNFNLNNKSFQKNSISLGR